VAGDVQWNFEKFLIDPDGVAVGQFHRTQRGEPARGDRSHPAELTTLTSSGKAMGGRSEPCPSLKLGKRGRRI
jgi:hypothetical protein